MHSNEEGIANLIDSWRKKLKRCHVPEHMHDGLIDWMLYGQRSHPGNFLTAVLRNDLKEACGRADHINIMALPAFVSFLYNHAPSGSWGSVAKFDSWEGLRKEVQVKR